jgi:hypothetical protein
MSAMLSPEAGIPSPPSTTPAIGEGGYLLRQSGGKPLRIRGELLAECTSRTPAAPTWQELQIFRCDDGKVALALRTCRDNRSESDVFHAHLFDSLEQALAWLQSFDPAADLFADLDASDRRISATEIALRAASLRQRADWVEMQYRSMIGELLFQFDIG